MFSVEGRVFHCGNCWCFRMPGQEVANLRSAEPAGVVSNGFGVLEACVMTKISVAVAIISIPVRGSIAV